MAAPTRLDPQSRRMLAVVAVVALVVTATAALVWFLRPTDEPLTVGDPLVSAVYEPPANQVERLFVARDGQVFATLAVDPLAGRTELIRGGPEEEAYRYQRPAYGWLGWLASGGQTDAVAAALIVLTVLSVAGLVVALAAALQRSGASPAFALIALVTPGVMCNVVFIGPESLGTSLVVLAILRMRRSPDIVPWDAVALFAAAGLCRESLLLAPATLALMALSRRQVTAALRLATCAIPYVAWVGYLYVRIGAWPRGSVDGRTSLLPFGGAVEAVTGWTPFTMALIMLVVALGVLGLVSPAGRDLRAVLVAHVVFASVMGPVVWMRAEGVGRTMLPLAVLGLWAWAEGRARRTTPRLAEHGATGSVLAPA